MSHDLLRRDPETGQFVAVDSDENIEEDREVVSAIVNFTVAAEDLTSGNDVFTLDGSDVVIVDMTSRLDSDEVFVVHHSSVTAVISPDKTASAEHSYEFRSNVALDLLPAPVPEGPIGTGTPLGVAVGTEDSDDLLHQVQVSGQGDFADTATGVGGGGDYSMWRESTEWANLGIRPPALDQDDEVSAATTLIVKGSDDQSVTVTMAVKLTGRVLELR